MKASQVLILIIEDDVFLGESLKQGLTREGHQVHWVVKPDEAIDQIDSHQFDYVIVDCLLPQMTGVDFLNKVRQDLPQKNFKSILMSGIYNDKSFVQEALQKSQSIAFLKKPFDLVELTQLIKKDESTRAEFSNKSTYQFFSKEKVTAREKKNLLETMDEISGLDLPLVYSILSETKSSGFLNIYYPDGVISGVTFSGGSITSVDIEDKNTYLGEMLIQSGFIRNEDLQKALEDKSKKKLGAKLMQMNLISPHAFDLIMAEQMNLRLSRTITQDNLKINFATSDVEYVSPAIDSEQIVQYLHDWIVSKIPSVWFKKLYFPWVGHRIFISNLFKSDHMALSLPLMQSLGSLTKNIQLRPTLGQLVCMSEYHPMAVLKCIHFLLIKGLIYLSDKNKYANENEQLGALRSMKILIQDMEPRDLNEVLNWSDSNFLLDIKSQIGEKPSSQNQELLSLWKEWQNLISDNEKKYTSGEHTSSLRSHRRKTKEELAEAKFKSSQIVEQMKQDLQLNQFAKAQDKFKLAMGLDPDLYQAHLFSAWIKLGLLDKNKDKNIQLKDIEIELVQVPPDEKYDALYPFVQGLFMRAQGDFKGAKKSLEKSVAMDTTFLSARRELGFINSLESPKQDILNMDLKQVMSGLFKKKS